MQQFRTVSKVSLPVEPEVKMTYAAASLGTVVSGELLASAG
jgi:hypothetical protein